MSAGAHIFHFILTLVTGGFWLPLWIICALCSGSSHKKSMRKLQEENNRLLRKLTEKGGD